MHVGSFDCSQTPCGHNYFLQFIVHKKNVPHNVFIDQLRTKTSFFKKTQPAFVNRPLLSRTLWCFRQNFSLDISTQREVGEGCFMNSGSEVKMQCTQAIFKKFLTKIRLRFSKQQSPVGREGLQTLYTSSWKQC